MRFSLPILLILLSAQITSYGQGLDYQIGNGTSLSGSTSHPTPLFDYYMGSRIQILYRASDLQAAGMGPGFIYSIKWDVTAIWSGATIYDWRLYIGTTTSSALSINSWEPTPSTLVYFAGTNNPYNPGTGVKTYTLSTPFYWNGTDNIILETCHGNSGRASNSWTENASVAYNNTSYVSYHYYQQDNSGSHCGQTSTSTSYTGTLSSRPNTVFNWGPAGYNNAGVDAVVNPIGKFCPGTYQLKVKIKNQGQNSITGVKIYWELDGVLQPVVNYSGTLTTVSGGSYTANVDLGFVNFSGADRQLKIYTSMPNNIADTVNLDDTLRVSLGPSPKAKITPSGPTVFCTAGNINVTLDAPAGAGNIYQWFRDGNPIPGATNSAFTATLAGDYTVRIDSNGCQNTSPVTRVDNLAMPLPLVHPAGYPVLCNGDSITLVANAGVTGATYQWQFQGADIPGATNASYTVSSPGNYTVIATKYICNASSAGINVVPATQPTPMIFEETSTTTYTLKTQPVYVSYQWRRDGNDIPGATNFAYVPTQNGTYTVVVSNGGCDAESEPIIVGNVGVGSIYSSSAINIYPNPATGYIYTNAPTGSNITITGIDGKILVQQKTDATAINISYLENGIYLVKIADENGNILKIEKLLKTN